MIAVNIPDKNEKLAEFIGIMLGDGNVYVADNGIFQISVAGNSEKEKDYITNHVRNTFIDLFGLKPQIKFHSTRKCVYARINSKLAVEFLISIGLKSGNKIDNEVTIPDWIWCDKTLLKSCIRGLIDTDGSVYRLKPHWPNLFQLSFKSNNKRLLNDTHRAFISLGFNVSKVFGNRIVITRQDEIAKYFKEIGTHNLRYSPVTAPSRG